MCACHRALGSQPARMCRHAGRCVAHRSRGCVVALTWWRRLDLALCVLEVVVIVPDPVLHEGIRHWTPSVATSSPRCTLTHDKIYSQTKKSLKLCGWFRPKTSNFGTCWGTCEPRQGACHPAARECARGNARALRAMVDLSFLHARDVRMLAGGLQHPVEAAQALLAQDRLQQTEVSADGESQFHLSARCTGSNGELYRLMLGLSRPPHQLLVARSCDCAHFVGSLSHEMAEGEQKLCKHLLALLLAAQRGGIGSKAPASSAAFEGGAAKAQPATVDSTCPAPASSSAAPAPAAVSAAPARVAAKRVLPRWHGNDEHGRDRPHGPNAQPAGSSAETRKRKASAPTTAQGAPVAPARSDITADLIHQIAARTLLATRAGAIERNRCERAADTHATAGPHRFPRPRGAAPMGMHGVRKTWCAITGTWVDDHAAPGRGGAPAAADVHAPAGSPLAAPAGVPSASIPVPAAVVSAPAGTDASGLHHAHHAWPSSATLPLATASQSGDAARHAPPSTTSAYVSSLLDDVFGS